MAASKIPAGNESEMHFPVTVELRPVDKGKLRAVADVTIALGPQGTVKLCGFAVFSDGKAPHVGAPSRQGKSRYFDTVVLNGEIRRSVETAVITEFESQGLN
jgi:DNA-binding cell septation regulator SpoVG